MDEVNHGLWNTENVEKLLDIGIALSGEKDLNKLLERILGSVMELTKCDAGTLYLLEENALHFRIMYNHSMQSYQGGDGKVPELPPVPLNRSSVCALAVLEKQTICIDDVRHCTQYDLTGPIRYDAMTGYYTKSMLVVPMKNRTGEYIGVLQLINAMDDAGDIKGFSRNLVKAVESVASQAAVTIQNVRYMQEIKGLLWSMVQMVSYAVDERTPYNLSHTRHMAEYGERFLIYLNQKQKDEENPPLFSEERQQEILMSIWLHDIGKLVTPLWVMNKEARLTKEQLAAIDSRLQIHLLQSEIMFLKGECKEEDFVKIKGQVEQVKNLIQRVNSVGFLREEDLQEINQVSTYMCMFEGEEYPLLEACELELLKIRKGTLSEDERKIMENHVVLTRKLLSKIRFSKEFSHVSEWAASHHELLNGSGYPRHLKGEEIPREVRLITILDIFDALVADDRPYKPGIPIEKALSILTIMAEEEGKLDPVLTKAFLESKCWEREDEENPKE